MSEYMMVPYPPEYSGSGQLGLSEDDCADLVDLDWLDWMFNKISFWHPYIMRG